MPFAHRTEVSTRIIHELNDNYWLTDIIKNKYLIHHIPYGYETHIDENTRKVLISKSSKTAKHIRFTPDFLLFQNNNSMDFLLEYKVTKTPRYSFGKAQWNYGQIEADAWDNYMNLMNANINVAIIIYCPYHNRPLLCDIPSQNWIFQGRQSTSMSRGSGTDFVNIDLTQLSTFDDFMEKIFNIPTNITKSLLNASFFNRLKDTNILQIDHHPSSYLKNIKAGFNWDTRYK